MDLKVDLDDITYLIGDNGKVRQTIGSLPLWIMTGLITYMVEIKSKLEMIL